MTVSGEKDRNRRRRGTSRPPSRITRSTDDGPYLYVVGADVDPVSGRKSLINFELRLPPGANSKTRISTLAAGMQEIWKNLDEPTRVGLREQYDEQRIVSFRGIDLDEIANLGEDALARKKALRENGSAQNPQ